MTRSVIGRPCTQTAYYPMPVVRPAICQMIPERKKMQRRAAPDLLPTIRFGDYLVERKLIDRQQLFVALGFHVRRRCRIGEAVAYFGFVEPEEVERIAAEYHSLQAVEV